MVLVLVMFCDGTMGVSFVKFSKVWNARGCAFVLDGTKKLFGGDGVAVSHALENDLPDTLKMSEARKRDAVSAAKKAAKASKTLACRSAVVDATPFYI